ncbi:unnamed protein product [Rotaria sp. Silwood2]|nr:unnamed protein product [Rotaria sp. Silwood2]CAF3959009.1 unnamed protein product [Rotaria sp. Silwood2]CAF3977308.1 unnamed protein product [Rotaria sp. Silwood2]
MHATKLANIGIKYLGDLQLDDLYQLQDELNTLWKNGQSTISNNLYDKIVDSINYEITQLKNDPYNYAVTKTDNELKKLIDYLTNLHSRGQSPIENSIWDILDHELTMRNTINFNSSLAHPSHWTTMSLSENPIQFIKLCRSSQEFQDISNFFSKSLQKSSTVIYSIIRIQNLRLWNIFQELQKIISNNIQRLFHGTASISHQKLIMYHGFYHSFCPGGLIGDGVYFAVNANYSNNDSYVLKKTNHRRELFICQVLLGNSSQGGSGVKSPAQGCHSVFHHNNTRNDMFCIFNSYQAYPEYIVQYDYE